MGYAKIPNLYKEQDILLFRHCWAMEKIHGTSAHIRYENDQLTFFSGGANHTQFVQLFDQATLLTAFRAVGHPVVTVFGEAYGGAMQGNSWRYGQNLRFVAFEVRIGTDDASCWLSVPDADHVVSKLLGLEFVHYVKIEATVEAIDAERDAPSVQAVRNGIVEPQPREGVVLRPIKEFRSNAGRIVSKHKRDDERETRTPRKIDDPQKLRILEDARAIAFEWVTPTRLQHVLDKMTIEVNVQNTGAVIAAMLADIEAEARGEIVMSDEARKAIKTETGKLFRRYLQNRIGQ